MTHTLCYMCLSQQSQTCECFLSINYIQAANIVKSENRREKSVYFYEINFGVWPWDLVLELLDLNSNSLFYFFFFLP